MPFNVSKCSSFASAHSSCMLHVACCGNSSNKSHSSASRGMPPSNVIIFDWRPSSTVNICFWSPPGQPVGRAAALVVVVAVAVAVAVVAVAAVAVCLPTHYFQLSIIKLISSSGSRSYPRVSLDCLLLPLYLCHIMCRARQVLMY